MKKATLCGIAMAIAVGGYAQKSITVPASVKTAFQQKFPNASSVKWSKENSAEFEAEFTNGMQKQAANFNSKGEWVVTETEIKKADVPQPVTAAVQKSFSGYEVNDFEKVEKPGKAMYYETTVKKEKKKYVVEVSSTGKILKKEVEKEEKED